MEDYTGIDWLLEVVRCTTLEDPTLPRMTDRFLNRWVVGVQRPQLFYLARCAAGISLGEELKRGRFPAIILKAIRCYKLESIVVRREQPSETDTNNSHNLVGISSPKPLPQPHPTPTNFNILTTEVRESVAGQNSRKGFTALYAPLKAWKVRARPTAYFRNVNVQEKSVQDIVERLNGLTPQELPIATITTYLEVLTSGNHDITALVFEYFRSTVGTVSAISPGTNIPILLKSTHASDKDHQLACQCPWNTSGITSMCIFGLATPAHELEEFSKGCISGDDNPLLLADHMTIDRFAEQILVPPMNLRIPYRYAKASALGPQKKTTLLLVGLFDKMWYRLPQNATRKDYKAFTHSFVLGIGPEGMVMYQSFADIGPRLHEHMAIRGAKVRDWQEADEFIDMFIGFTSAIGSEQGFTARKNEQYRSLFGIDLLDVIDKGMTTAKSMTPTFRTWVDIRILEDVKASDVTKFTWLVDEDESTETKAFPPGVKVRR